MCVREIEREGERVCVCVRERGGGEREKGGARVCVPLCVRACVLLLLVLGQRGGLGKGARIEFGGWEDVWCGEVAGVGCAFLVSAFGDGCGGRVLLTGMWGWAPGSRWWPPATRALAMMYM